MFVGETGVGRVLRRSATVMNDNGISDPYDIEKIRELGVIDLPTLQKKVNFHYSLTLDLFGSEISTNAANAFNAGVKGRYHETKIDDDHLLVNNTYPVLKLVNSSFQTVDEPALNAINARLLDDYINEAERGVNRWNNILQKAGVEFEIKLPHRAFHRVVGEFSDISVTPDGELIDADAWSKRQNDWLPTQDDTDYLLSLMKPVVTKGEFSSWISPPKAGINNQVGDFEYVRLEDS